MKSKAAVVVRCLLSALLLAWLLSRTDFAAVGAALRHARWGWFAAGTSLHVVGVLLTAWRWGILLKAQGLHVPTLYLARSFLIASFFNYFLPTSVGGDVYRAFDVGRYTRQPERALGILLVERVSGLFALVLLAVGAAPWAAHLFGSRVLVYAPLAILGLFILGGLLLFWNRFVETAGSIFLLPGLSRVKDRARAVHEAIVAYRNHKGAIGRALLVGLALQLNFVLHHYLLARAVGMELSLGIFLLLVPIVSILLLIPASINGIGIRENAFVVFLGSVGVDRGIAVAFCSLLFAAMLLFGVVGGLVYAFSGRSTHRECRGSE